MAETRAEVIARLHGDNAFPLRVRETRPKRLAFDVARLRAPWRSQKAPVIVTAELSMLIGAGLTVDRALTIVLDRVQQKALQEALGRVRTRVRGGAALAEAMAGEPQLFSMIYIALVRAGEMSGHLDQALSQLHTYLSRRDTLANQVRGALVYPAVLVAAGIGVFFVLSDFVLPQFVALFAEAGRPLPLPAQIVVSVSHFMAIAWPYLLVAGLGAAVVARRFLSVSLRLHGALLRVPVIGQLWRTLDAARMARTAGALLQSRVSLPDALEIAFQTFTNAAMAGGAATALQRIREGRSASQALLDVGILPRISTELLAVGEEVGRVDDMLTKQADLLETSASRQIAMLLTLLVPALTIVIGAMVGLVMFAVMVAVLQLNEAVR